MRLYDSGAVLATNNTGETRNADDTSEQVACLDDGC